MKVSFLVCACLALVSAEDAVAAEKETAPAAFPAVATPAFPWKRSTNLLQPAAPVSAAAPASATAPNAAAAPTKPFFDPFFFGMYYPYMWMWYMPWMWMWMYYPFMWMWW